MKVRSSHNQNYQYHNDMNAHQVKGIHNLSQNNKNVAFGSGIGAVPVLVMDSISRGGLCATFCVQDFFGLILPRIATGFTRNRDVTHEYNYGEAAEVSIREILTGPPMFIIPMVGFAAFKRVFGKACDVPVDFIKSLGALYKNKMASAGGSPENLKQKYYTHVMENVLNTATDKSLSKTELSTLANEYVTDILDIEKSKPKSIWKRILNKPLPESSTDKTQNLVDKFVALRKKYVKSSAENFESIVVNSSGRSSSCSFEKLLTHMKNYTEDIASVLQKKVASPEAIKAFNKNRIVMRNVTNFAMLAAVLGFCIKIPDMYQIHKVNPGLKGLVGDPDEHASKNIKVNKNRVDSVSQHTHHVVATSPSPNIDFFMSPFKKNITLNSASANQRKAGV